LLTGGEHGFKYRTFVDREEKVGAVEALTEHFSPAIVRHDNYPAENGRTAEHHCLSGGGYEMKAGHEGEPIARWLNQ
jgi:hypothetical protein